LKFSSILDAPEVIVPFLEKISFNEIGNHFKIVFSFVFSKASKSVVKKLPNFSSYFSILEVKYL